MMPNMSKFEYVAMDSPKPKPSTRTKNTITKMARGDLEAADCWTVFPEDNNGFVVFLSTGIFYGFRIIP